MMRNRGHEFFDWNVEGLAHPQERNDSDGPTGLHHLPMADTEAERNHIFLAQFARGSACADFMPEPAKEASVMSRDFSTGPHFSTLAQHEQKHHEQNCISFAKVGLEKRRVP
jgi:hypothetical protein